MVVDHVEAERGGGQPCGCGARWRLPMWKWSEVEVNHVEAERGGG